MEKLYFNDTGAKITSRPGYRIFLAETPEGVYRDPGLQQQMVEWLLAHRNDSELNYGKFLYQKVIWDTPSSMPFAPDDKSNRACSDRLAVSFELCAEKNLNFLLAQCMIEGVADPVRNEQNFKRYVQFMVDDINALKETSDYVLRFEDREFINETLKLATEDSPELAGHIKDSPIYQRFYGFAPGVSTGLILQRSKELKAAELSSATLADISRKYNELAQCDSAKDFNAHIPGTPPGNNPFNASRAHQELFPAAPKIVPATLASPKVFTLRDNSAPDRLNWEHIEQKFDVIKYVDCGDQVNYFVKSRKKINVLEQGRG